MDIINRPGKFEGEPTYVEHYYELLLNGGSDETIYDGETAIEVFGVAPEDVLLFPDLDGVANILLWIDESGFCNSRQMSHADLEAFRAECEATDDDDEPNEPQEEDITADDPSGPFVYLGKRIAANRAELRAWMEREKYFPNVWFISDHGNAHLLTDIHDPTQD